MEPTYYSCEMTPSHVFDPTVLFIFFLNLNYFFVFKLFLHANIKNKFKKIKNYFDVFLNKKYFEKQFLPYFQTGP
jgi:hypothetical protein